MQGALRPDEAAGVLHDDRRPGHGRQDPGTPPRPSTRPSTVSWSCSSSTTRSTARSATRAASAPAEPGDEQRARPPGSRTSNGPTPSRSTSPPRCCSTGSGACSAPAARASRTRLPVTLHRPRRARRPPAGGHHEEHPFESHFSGNTVQICPVGALTGSAYRFRSRPFDLVSTPSACEHRQRLLAADRPPSRHRAAPDGPERPGGQRGVELRQGPLGLQSANVGDRLQFPMVRKGGELVVASWPEALDAAAAGYRLTAAGRPRPSSPVAV